MEKYRVVLQAVRINVLCCVYVCVCVYVGTKFEMKSSRVNYLEVELLGLEVMEVLPNCFSKLSHFAFFFCIRIWELLFLNPFMALSYFLHVYKSDECEMIITLSNFNFLINYEIEHVFKCWVTIQVFLSGLFLLPAFPIGLSL